MRMKNLSPLCLLLAGTLTAAPLASGPSRTTDRQKKEKATTPLYRNASAPIEERVSDLLGRMTREEKILQLTQGLLGGNDNANNIGKTAGSVPAEIGSVIYTNETPLLRNELQHRALQSRLGIPVLFGYDIIHGFRTGFPIPLAVSASFNPSLAERGAHIAALEGQAAGVDWTFSPMLDVPHDSRWGRVMEGYGEDPYTTARFGEAVVRGYQGDDLTARTGRMAACLKHYVGYAASEAGIDYARAEVSHQTLWDTYLPPFEASIKAGAQTVMAGFCDISGIPASANHYTLTEILKQQWGHEGFVVADWNSVSQLQQQRAAADGKEAAGMALNAGLEMDMVDDLYRRHLPALLDEGKVSEATLDEAVRRVLRVKFRLGLFEHPLTDEKAFQKSQLRPEYLQAAEETAAESYVLLKNKDNLLPLGSSARLAVMGPLADNAEHLIGAWRAHVHNADAQSLLEGLKEEFKDRVTYVKGCDFEGTDTTGFARAAKAAAEADVLVLCMGEKNQWSGENSSVGHLELPALQQAFVRAMKRTGKPVILVLSSGRAMALGTLEPYYDALLEIWKPGLRGGRPLAGMLSGRLNPSGRLTLTFPYSTAQVPVYYNRRRSSRPTLGLYRDIPSRPLYEFGSGLSYSHFVYSAPRVNGRTVEVDVTNDSHRDGSETVLWYVTAPSGIPTRPDRELRHFEKRTIAAGKTETFRFAIDPERDLSYPDATGRKTARSGHYTLWVGGKKAEITLP